jgi:hypothetical protein
LFQHPDVAAGPETHLFTDYLNIVEDAWALHEPRKIGLPDLLSREEFIQLMRPFAIGVIDKIAAKRPAAKVVVEKTPDHCRHGELINAIFPEAYFLHVVRDPRGAANSLLQASKSWAADWAPADAIGAAKRWRNNVVPGREIGHFAENYKEVKYEDLLTSGIETLRDIFDWLAIDTDQDQCAEILEACRIDNIRSGASGFQRVAADPTKVDVGARRGETNSWKDELTKQQIKLIEAVAGDLMVDFGYVMENPAGSRAPLQLVIREFAEGIFTSMFRFAVKFMPAAMTSSAKKIGTEALR